MAGGWIEVWCAAMASYVATWTRWRRCGARVDGSNDADELGKLVDFEGSASRRKRVVGQVIYTVPHLVVGIDEYLHMPPRVLDGSRMSERCHTWGGKKTSIKLRLPCWNHEPVADWCGRGAYKIRCDPPTLPSITVITLSVDAPGYSWSALPAQHTAWN
jgi:hypothetical protein